MQPSNRDTREADTRQEPADTDRRSGADRFRTIQPHRSRTRRYLLFGLIGLLFLVLVGALLVSRAVPGDTLYGLKTKLFEDTLGGISTPGGEAGEQMERMRTRLDELKTLHMRSELTAEALQELTEKNHEHATAFKALVTAEDTPVAPDDALALVSDMTSIVRTQERIVKFGTHPDDQVRRIERTRKYVVDLRDELIERLAEEGDGQMARDFIAEHLDVLSAEIAAGGLAADRIAVTEDYVRQVAEALIADDLPRALEAVTKAEELIELDRYIRDVSEDPDARG